MKTLSIIFAVTTVTLIASRFLCGSWLAAKGATTEDIAFHRKLAIGASIATLATAAMTIVLAVQ